MIARSSIWPAAVLLHGVLSVSPVPKSPDEEVPSLINVSQSAPVSLEKADSRMESNVLTSLP